MLQYCVKIGLNTRKKNNKTTNTHLRKLVATRIQLCFLMILIHVSIFVRAPRTFIALGTTSGTKSLLYQRTAILPISTSA
jgi:hypothetical protein